MKSPDKKYIAVTVALDAVGIPYPKGRNNFTIDCPECGKSKKLTVDVARGVFNCPVCQNGWGGEKAASALYALHTFSALLGKGKSMNSDLTVSRYERDKLNQENRDKIEKAHLFLKELTNTQTYVPTMAQRHEPETPRQSAMSLNAVYKEFLKLCSLEKGHHTNLVQRGLTLDLIHEQQFKSVPTQEQLKNIAHTLTHKGFDLKGVPGFYQAYDGSWNAVGNNDGLYIPVTNEKREIVGLQIRLDNPKEKSKYIWFSSRNQKEGSSSGTPAHMIGYPEKLVIFTEGPLKATCIHRFTNKTVVGIAGVGAFEGSRTIMERLKEAGTQTVLLAFDMDYKTNPNVQRDLKKTIKFLKSFGFEVKQIDWDTSKGKGYDDYLFNTALSKQQFKLDARGIYMFDDSTK